jgi:hypothetical protein
MKARRGKMTWIDRLSASFENKTRFAREGAQAQAKGATRHA